MRRARLILLLATLVAAVGASSAKAALTIEDFETTSTTSEAGGHPDLRTHIKLGTEGAAEVAKNISFDAPRGLFGNPGILTQCTALDFALQQCAPNAQMGLVVIRADYAGEANKLMGTAPIYSLEAGPEEAARFAFYVPILNLSIAMPVTVRSADYGLRFTVSGITQEVPLTEANITLWGFPAASGEDLGPHDSQRFAKGSPGHPAGCVGESWEVEPLCPAHANEKNGFPGAIGAGLPNQPFLGNPSVCGQSTETGLDVETYQRPGVVVHASSSYPETTNCARQVFQPVAQAQLTTGEADSASGFSLQFTIPQAKTSGASPSSLRAATLTLPEGLTINPDAADGQTACPDVDAEFGTEARAHCPDSAKVGTVTLKSGSLPGDIDGSIYLGEPKPGNQYRVFVIAEDFGIKTKLIGKLLPDPGNGQLTFSFDELPQLPLEKFEMHLFASDRGILATPTQCSVYTVQADLFPWNPTIADVKGEFGLSVDSGPFGKPCPPGGNRPFEPKLNAGTSNSKAGSYSNFTLDLDREDGDQYLGDLGFTMPPGLTGSLRGIAYCPESGIAAAGQKLGRAEQATPSCPPQSEIGTTNVAAGPGLHPFHATGRMYMAGPFKGAPLSLVAITPALAGPYDYGVVVVRVAVRVDPSDAHVIAISDTVPSIIGGIPLRLRSIEVNLTKPEFILNPTNCSPMSVGSKGIGDQGTTTEFSSYFQAVNCGVLPFKPQMKMKYLSGGKSRAKNPALEFALKTRPGDANIKSLSVTLPQAFAIDQRHLGNICSEKQLAAEECAGRAPIGKATTNTPLLDQPLSGIAYAVSGSGGLPRLAFILDGQVKLVPRAETKSVDGGRLQTTVPVVPDAPIGAFRLTLFGGKQGYLSNTRNLCNKQVVTTVAFVAQNGRKFSQNVRLRVPCKGAKAKKKKRTTAH
jgi:hypothetical protein